ncbi:AAA family ATPase [[Kitasatospora] papulosa]|uniref:AAA family ATPase n=1 Tax=[Kitasatospora] papulosa TaxID=1464011 RepID=UPI00363A37C1
MDEETGRNSFLMAYDEGRRRNATLAAELEKVAARRTSRSRPLTVNPRLPLPLSDDDMPLVTVSEPDITLPDLVLTAETSAALDEIIREHRQKARLAAHGLRPRSRLLLAGPSGTGKTRTAEALAHALGVPIIKVRLAALVSSYLGQTARHLDRILEYARQGSWVLSFDEIDMLAGEREVADHGEMRRVATVLLQQLEEYESDNPVIATTNHATSLDAAIWRRFDEVLVYRNPTQSQITEVVQLKLRRASYKINKEIVARSLAGMSHAEVERVCLDAMRQAALSNHATITTSDLTEKAAARKKRYKEAGKSQS